MASENQTPIAYPHNPLESVVDSAHYRRSLVFGILESYNSNYDFLAEALQNAVDAVEDASLQGLAGPFDITVTVNLKDNCVSVLDTGIGMSESELSRVLAPHVSLKSSSNLLARKSPRNSYRGYKGVGLTLLAYGTDNLAIHSRREGADPVPLRMRYGNAWAKGARNEPALIDRDNEQSPLERHKRGTFIQLQFSSSTRPRSLRQLSAHPEAWATILRTRTALGQFLLDRSPLVDLRVSLTVISTNGESQSTALEPRFLFPHTVVREPSFRFLSVNDYYSAHPENSEVPTEFRRQDGIHLFWDTERITREYTAKEKEDFADQLTTYGPTLYAFVPYQASVWGEINELLTKAKARIHLAPGLALAINRQRMAELQSIDATRYETFSRNVFVAVHFDNARPDQGRKTVQDEVLGTAKAAANRAVQYLAKQRTFLRPIGERPSAQQRKVEKNKEDWEYNVRKHQEQSPLHIPPVTYESEPLTEQDVVGLYHQLSALGVFPGVRFLATSQSQTYDSYMYFRCANGTKGLRANKSVLGLAPSVIGDIDEFQTHRLTLEFKNNLDSLIADIEDESRPKQFQHIDICVCWASVQESFPGYELDLVGQGNLDQRQFPGTTHLLQRDGDSHTIEVVMLSTIRRLVENGELSIG